MKKSLTIFVIFSASLSCMTSSEKPKSETKTLPDTTNQTEFAVGKKFFDYDQIDHFFNDFDANKFWELTNTRNISPIDSIKGGVLSRRIPKAINDTFFVAKLERAEFKKSSLDISKFSKIDEIFAEKKYLLIQVAIASLSFETF